VATTVQLIRLVHETWDLLPRIQQPILVMQSRQDHTVMPINVHWLLNRVGSTEREILWLNESYHVITEDIEADRVAERVVSFVHRHTGDA
jgi:carboxylesterase